MIKYFDKEPQFDVKYAGEVGKVGHMRCDFADGYLSNSWFPAELSGQVNLAEIQKMVNVIMFEKITTFDEVVELCGGRTGYDRRTNLYLHTTDFNYRIDMIPVMGDYNYYIHVYTKGDKDKS